jgi:hypothetical protein
MPHLVTISGSYNSVVLPNGIRYAGGAAVLLSDAEYSLLGASFKSTYLTSDVAVALGGGTFTQAVATSLVPLTDAATIAVNAALGNDFYVTLGGNRTLGAPANPPASGQTQIIRIDVIQPASGGPYTLAYNPIYDFGAGSAPSLSTAANKVDTVAFRYIPSISKWAYLSAAFPQGF